MDATARPQLRVILVADDLSPGAGLALKRAALLAGAARGRVVQVLRVLPIGLVAHRGEPAAEEALAALRRRVAQLLGSRRQASRRPAMSAAVVEGEPFVEIVRHGRLVEAELVVMGDHARGTWRDALVGTTSERVIRKGDVPVLIVKRPPRGPYRRVVVAIEPSDAATRVIELAVALAGTGGGRLTVVSCFTVPFETEISGGVRQVIALTRREHHDARRSACERIVAAARGARALSPGLEVVHGDPRIEVLRWIERERADLLVLGTHARSGIAHALLGSTAEALVRAAPCDVAVTRPVRFTFEMP